MRVEPSLLLLAAVVSDAVPVVAEDHHRVRRWLLKLALQYPLALNLVWHAPPASLNVLASTSTVGCHWL